MIIRFILVIIEILLFYLLQTSVFPYFALAGVVPDLLMILTVSVAFTRGRIQGMLTGLAAGLLMDFCFSSIVGFYGRKSAQKRLCKGLQTSGIYSD